MTQSPPPSTRLLDYLPALFQESADGFLPALLEAFQVVLLDGDKDVDGLEQVIARLATYFDPGMAPKEFLPWLAGWVAFSLQANLDEDHQRTFLGNVVTLYPWRGTKSNLQRLLKLFTLGQGDPVINEDQAPEAQLGVHSTLGKDFYLEGGPPFSFEVTIYLGKSSADVLSRQIEIARSLIEMEKPAHTRYQLIPIAPSMQLGTSRLGVDTFLAALVPV